MQSTIQVMVTIGVEHSKPLEDIQQIINRAIHDTKYTSAGTSGMISTKVINKEVVSVR